MTPTSHRTISARTGVPQLIAAAVLLAYLLFTSEWRFWITVEIAIVIASSGLALVVYPSVPRRLPFRKLVETWLPMPPLLLAAFLVLFGAGLAAAENGNSVIGIALIIAGYGTYSAQGILQVVRLLAR